MLLFIYLVYIDFFLRISLYILGVGDMKVNRFFLEFYYLGKKKEMKIDELEYNGVCVILGIGVNR